MAWSGLSRTFSNSFLKKSLTHFLTEDIVLPYNIYIMTEKKTRPTKKALVKQLEERGVDKNIVASLQRANIDTLVWVLNKIS
tara:strand:- start:510 stop:755 length:246 start_codon:yes stop_codon:yes gene_type:complete